MQQRRSWNFVDLTGQRFGSLLVVRLDGTPKHKPRWEVRCDCGVVKTVLGYSLRLGLTKTCGGETHRLRAPPSRLKHGQAAIARRTPEYRSWAAIVHRCTQPSCGEYHNYGGRGITVCSRWRESFENFFADMGPRPAGTSIDRIDVNGHYEPGNCRWATAKEQARNRRNTKMFTYRGKTQVVADWASEFGVPMKTLWWRLRRGWPMERACLKAQRRTG